MLGTAPVTILPTPAVRTPPHHTYGPGPAPCSGRGPASPRAPQGGTLSASSRRPEPPPSRGPGSPRDSRTSLVHAPALRPRWVRDRHAHRHRWRTYIRKTLTCRAHGAPPRHIWRTVHPTATTTLTAGVGRTPARSPQDKDDTQDDCHARRHAPQCTFHSARPLHPRDSGEDDDFYVPLLMYTAPPCDYKRRRRASFKGDVGHIAQSDHLIERNTQHH